MVFDLIDGETRERSWELLKKGGRLISTLTEPSQDRAKALGVTAMRYTVEPDGEELAEIGRLADAGKLKPHVQATFPLEQAADALASVERGHTAGKVVLTCA
jgi:NADPH:quinone reductase-like Zn-dependent oxidoreductase